MSSIDALLGSVTQRLSGGGEDRPGQRKMAQAVKSAISTTDAILVEAGTGTGKSVAYLTPIVASEARAVVATSSIALQSQLLDKDIPLVSEGLEMHVDAVVLKGRSNYLCLQRLAELDRADAAEQLQLLGGLNQADGELKRIREWAAKTDTGDREELDISSGGDAWRAVSVGPDECPGAGKCPSGDQCFAESARNLARDADIVITNHHYYGLHLATGGALIGEHDVVVFDEAHHLPEVLSSTCGTEVSGGRLRALARRARGILADTDIDVRCERSAADLDSLIRESRGQRVELTADLVSALVMARSHADEVLDALRKIKPGTNTDVAARVERATKAGTALVLSIDKVMESADDDVVWVDGSDAAPVLKCTPLDVGHVLSENLYAETSVVFTSATLPQGIVSTLGMNPSKVVERVGSPFDYENQALLYCAAHLPSPRSASGGEALREGLFTSARAMREATEYLREHVDFPVLMQGDSSKQRLIDEFMDDPQTVLMATMSFWQGVDLPGDSLTLVTIDRLPFPRPDEPVTQARRDRAGPRAFGQVDLPRAQVLLAQAAGRLIRQRSDQGVVAVLDSRLATSKSYRWEVINALPPLRRTRDKDEVLDFLRKLDQ
jgi:ATP-dependent DNA helicase DinG